MIDTWFKDDLKNIFSQHAVAVFIDESGEADYLLRSLDNSIEIHTVNSEVDELKAKYLLEKERQVHPNTDRKFLIYTQQAKSMLTFVREYCETNGCLEIRYLQNYIKDKVYQTLNLNINLAKDELITAAKVSVGKDKTYWMDLSHKGTSEIFDLNKELLPFLHDPIGHAKEKYDAKIRETFYRKVNELIGQDYFAKPPATLAAEVVKFMLNGLAANNCHKTLASVYVSWLDSISYQSSFPSYLEKYSIAADVDIWSVAPNHPFRQVDEQWLKVIGSKITDKSNVPNVKKEYLDKLKQRHQSKQAQSLNIEFWADIIVLLKLDPKDITYLSTFEECVEFYKKHFCALDTAIRNLYTLFLHQRDLLEPFQELYKEYVAIFLDKWFKYFDQYKENQTGILQRIIDTATSKTAIIVGDGVAYEIAEEVAKKVNVRIRLTRNSILADAPSETENNMSHIYMENGVVEAVQNKREKYLTDQNPNRLIDYARLDEVNGDARAGEILICTYKDIDDMGDKLNHKALKYFPESIDFFAEKISLLINSGYAKVYLITDHGFVLTGLLRESDKIVASPAGKHYVDERFIWSTDKQSALVPQLIEVKKSYKDYNYLYFARNMNPFKTPGAYGFSHGGLCPQELVTPYFCWEKENDGMDELPVSIINKSDLVSVTGELFQIKMKADVGGSDLFNLERKVHLVFFANKVQINKSDIFLLKSDTTVVKEYAFDGHDEVEIQLLDATSKQMLDKVLAKKNNDRDLGGLF